MGIVRSIQKGEQPASKFDKDAQDVAKGMKKKDVKDFASTKHKGLPMKKEILGKLKEMINFDFIIRVNLRKIMIVFSLFVILL